MKSRNRYRYPDRWLPVATPDCLMMQRDNARGGYVRADEYDALHRAYLGALVQLDRAAALVGRLKRGEE